jgi:hypothetical protein
VEKLEVNTAMLEAKETTASSPPIKRQKLSSESSELNENQMSEETAPTKSCIPPSQENCEVAEEDDLSPEEGEIKEDNESATNLPFTGLPTLPSPNRNVVYGLWSIRKKQPDRLADSSWERASAEIKLLVRTNYHAYEVRKDEIDRPIE